MRVRKLAHDRDQKVIEQRKAEAERAAVLAAPSETVLDDVIEIDADSGLVDTYESREG
jgi:DNA-directed RNA polymerase subunit beta'